MRFGSICYRTMLRHYLKEKIMFHNRASYLCPANFSNQRLKKKSALKESINSRATNEKISILNNYLHKNDKVANQTHPDFEEIQSINLLAG